MASAEDGFPDQIYPALTKPVTELERIVVEMLTEPHGDPFDYRDRLYHEARHRRLIP